MAAAQWIICSGQSLFKEVLRNGGLSAHHQLPWHTGKLYKGKAGLSLDRWHFWRECFRVISLDLGVSWECIGEAKMAADVMGFFGEQLRRSALAY